MDARREDFSGTLYRNGKGLALKRQRLASPSLVFGGAADRAAEVTPIRGRGESERYRRGTADLRLPCVSAAFPSGGLAEAGCQGAACLVPPP